MNNLDLMFTKDIKSFSTSYFAYLKKILDKIDLTSIQQFVEVLCKARQQGAMIFFIGNGGSAATASHFANDLGFGTKEIKKPFKAMSLTDNIPVLTALGNDFGFDEVFVQQLKVYAKPGDILVGISASGNSPNLIKSFQYANEAGIRTVAITAFDGGVIKEIANQSIHIPTEAKEYGPAEDAHMILDHLITAYLMRAIPKG